MKILCKRVLISVLLVLLISTTLISAVSAMDMTRSGTLKVRIMETGSSVMGVPGGRVELYQVATVDFINHAYVYVLTDVFAGVGLDLSKIGEMTASENVASSRSLVTYIRENEIQPMKALTPDSIGCCYFTGLPVGLYLIVQSEAANKHTTIDPALISMPQHDLVTDEWIYFVNAAPKIGTSGTTPTTKPPTPPGNLPQTGQLWWPVYLMAGAGLFLILFGAIRRKRSIDE